MLSAERKKTDKIDLAKPLQDYIRSHYTADAVQDHQEAINNLQQLREDVRNIQDKNDATRDLILKYYGLILSMELRFPISENNIRISFPWTDVYKNKKTTQVTLFFEKQCILFNIGAMYSQLGSLQNRSTADGLKSAFQSFSLSAGAFQELKEELERHPQPSVIDLSFDNINMLINLMLAQAQECFVEKAIKENMNPSIVAKLAAQTADFYDTANQLLTNNALKDNAPKAWAPHVQVKSAMSKATAQARLAAVHKEAEEYGSEVGRLKVARDLLEEAKKKYFKSVPVDLQNIMTSTQAQFQKSFELAEKDNDTIYHDVVPSEAKLSVLERRALAKPLPLPENVRLSGDRDPFTKLIPFAITEKLSIYQERKESLVRNEQKGIEEQSQFAVASLSSMNLPGSIEALEAPTGIPQAIEDKRRVVSSEGGARLILELVETLNNLATEDQSILDRAIAKLDEEEKEDNALRQQYGPKWSRTPSHTLTANLRQESSKFKQNIEHARKSDSIIQGKFQQHQQFLVKLTGTQADVSSMLPSSRPENVDPQIVAAIKQSLGQLDRLLAERDKYKKELMALSQSDDIAPKLLNSTNDEEIYQNELRKYEGIQAKIQKTYEDQGQLLERVHQDNSVFVANRGDGGQYQREQVLQQLNNAFKAYTELKNNLQEGIRFYTDFQDILKGFASKCSDFIFARQTEKTDMINEIQIQSTKPAPQPSYQPQPPQQSYQQPPPQAYQVYPPQQQQQQQPAQWNPNIKPVYASAPVQSAPPAQQQPWYAQPPPSTFQTYQQPQQPQQPQQSQPAQYQPGQLAQYQQKPGYQQPLVPPGQQPWYAQPPQPQQPPTQGYFAPYNGQQQQQLPLQGQPGIYQNAPYQNKK